MVNTKIQHLMNGLRKIAARDLIAIESFVAELVQTKVGQNLSALNMR